MTVKASKLISCLCSTKFDSSPLLGQPSESSTKKSVLEGDLVGTEDSFVGSDKGKVSEPIRVTRMTLKASKLIGCVNQSLNRSLH